MTMEIPDNVLEAALAAEKPAGDTPAERPEPEVEQPEQPEGDEPPAEGEGAEQPEGEEAPAEEAPVAEPSAAAPTGMFTAEQVEQIIDRLFDRLAPTAEAEAPAKVAEVIPPHIDALLKSAKPGAKEYGQQFLDSHRATEARISALEGMVERTALNEAVVAAQQSIDAVKGGFVIVKTVSKPGPDGKPTDVQVEEPVTDAHMDAVADYYDSHPEARGVLTVEEVARRLNPGMVKRSPKPATANAGRGGKEAPARRIVKVGSPNAGGGVQASGAAAGRVPSKPALPPQNETLEQAIDRGMRENRFLR